MRGSRIYGLETKDSDYDYLVICNKHTTFPKEFYNMREATNYGRRFDFHIVVDNCDFIFKTNEEWFDEVMNGSIEAWECACMNKKFIIKEHVKLLMKTDPLGLRKQIVKMDNAITEDSDPKDMWKVVAYCKFANQIIENHKIVNFKEANPERKTILEAFDSDNRFLDYKFCLYKPLELLKNSTDGMLKKEVQSKIIQK
jgi:hypothetical protein